jgi:HlyD family secretion protein
MTAGKPANYSPFRPGMTATVDIITEKRDNIVAVPISAVVVKSDTTAMKKDVVKELEEKEKEQQTGVTDKKYECVFIKVGDKAVLRPIKTGIQDDTNIEIVSGLKKGDEVIIGPYNLVSKELNPNDKIKTKPKDTK